MGKGLLERSRAAPVNSSGVLTLAWGREAHGLGEGGQH